jgi:hypothetical protein
VKNRIEVGVCPVRPVFGTLREGVRVAQENTPTALANSRARALQAKHADALLRIFGGGDVKEERERKGSFYRALPPLKEGPPQV